MYFSIYQETMGPVSKKIGIKQYDGFEFEHGIRMIRRQMHCFFNFIADIQFEYVRNKKTADEMWSSLINNF